MRLWGVCWIGLALLPCRGRDLTAADLPRIGDTVVRWGVSADGLRPGDAGTGVLWDFRDVTPMPETDHTVTYTAADDTPHGDVFPTADLAARLTYPADGTAVTHYARSGADGLWLLGSATDEASAVLQTAVPWLPLPLGYDETRTAAAGAATRAPGAAAEDDTTVTVTVDGQGSLLLPMGRFNDVLRVKTEHLTARAATVAGHAAQIAHTTYAWYAPGRRYPLLVLAETRRFSAAGVTVSRRASLAGEPSAVVDRYAPHLGVYGGDFTSRVVVRNAGAWTEQLTLHGFRADGTPTQTLPVTLAPGAVARLSHEALGTDTASLGLSGGGNCRVLVGYRAASGGGSGMMPTPTEATAWRVYRGETSLLFDGLALVNRGEAAARITATLLDDAGAAVGAPVVVHAALAPGAKVTANLSAAFAGRSGRVLAVAADQPGAAVFLRGSLDGRYLYANLPLVAAAGSGRRLPHLATYGGDFVTDILVHNLGDTPGRVQLQAFAAGLPLTAVPVTVAPGGTAVLDHAALGTSAEALEVTGDGRCVVSVGYRARVGGSTAHVHETAPAYDRYALAGERPDVWDGLAVVNAGGGTAFFALELLDDQGTVLATQDLGAAADEVRLPAVVTVGGPAGDGVLRITGNRTSALLLLRGSPDGRFLYHNPAF